MINHNAHGREFVNGGKEAAVRAAIGAVPLGTKKPHHQDARDKYKGNTHGKAWESCPEILSHHLRCETRPTQVRLNPRRNSESIEQRPHKHVQREAERQPHQQA